ncbi:hypothetical protein KP509_36G015300 [Ceratopteris richardii]|uniref:RING-type domain-containing protein n=1 Tax=Ceratopteris richardii TaxID=49495 RepID=A0A8T2QB14_CERRI|nr:hypothetical protein KP509_36G015300 [Ceratopteris richardii]KAH7280816.1 hypothetical protein KP509_36G015300 [Ceratopteris richardii]
MAAGCDEEYEQTDTLPLLMNHHPIASHEHILNITDEVDEPSQNSEDLNTSMLSSSQGETVISLDTSNVESSDHSDLLSNRMGSPSHQPTEGHGDDTSFESRQRISPLNSGLWISIELTITLSQIIASIIVLSLSRNENPKAPLSVWVYGYAAGCLATLPLLYWRYTHHHARNTEQNVHHITATAASPNDWDLPQSSLSSSGGTLSHSVYSNRFLSLVRRHSILIRGDPRLDMHIERFKIALDCFFAVWFVVGNVWIFGGHSSSREAPNLYRLCIVFLTFSFIGYAMPFIICATICCCLPCLITILGFREDQEQVKGAAPEVIEALPIYKFKQKDISGAKGCKDPNDSDGENFGDGVVIMPGIDQERSLSAEDAVCCICLGKYKNDDELRGLPCSHFFHVDCVDKWLKINGICPLCKHEITGSLDEFEQ